MRRAMAARSLLAAVLLLYIDQATNAPVTDDSTASHALQLADSSIGLAGGGENGPEERRILDFNHLLQTFLHRVADSMSPAPGTYAFPDGRGCYYNFEHYEEGDRILTNEPCLNCTCHNKMLMCYLRVCPFTKAIGQDCTVEKKPDQCCPVITCPQVPVALLTSSTTSESPPTTTALGRPDNYGCILQDNSFFPDGAQVPSDLKKPCELCYCIRNQTACVMQECTLNVEGCKPVYQEGVCCPVRYDCDYDEIPTTPKPVGLVTTPGGSSDCLHQGETYRDGEMVSKERTAPCEHCYCMRGDIVCAVQECGTPLEGRDCTPLEPRPGHCCPNYHCANTTQESVLTSTEKLPEAVKEESVQVENQDSGESSNESNNSSEESQEVPEVDPPKPSDATEEEEGHSHQPQQSTETPEIISSSQDLQTQQTTEMPQQSESESIKEEENVAPVEDSHSEASHHSESEAQAPQDVKDPQGTNEIPSLTPEQPVAETTTEGPAIETARIPGEGSCLVEGKTYAHNTIVPTENPCQEICRCFSSIVRCNPRDCPPAPSPDENCMPITTPGSCCPTYMCDQKTSDAPEVQDHKIDNIHEEGSSHIQDIIHSTHPPIFEEPTATEAPAIFGIPPESLVPGTNEHVETTGSDVEESNIPHSESDTQEKEETSTHHPSETTHSTNDNSHLDSNLVHSHDASLHGGQVENIDTNLDGNIHHPIHDISTIAPLIDETTSKSKEEEVITHRPEDFTTQTDKIISNEEQDIIKPQTDSPVENHEEPHQPENQTEPSEAETHNAYTTTEENINQDNGMSHDTYKPDDHSTEQNLENISESETPVDTHLPSEETYNEDPVTTDHPAVENGSSDNAEQQNVVSEGNNESNQPDEDIKTNQEEYHITESHEPQDNADTLSETTVLPAGSESSIPTNEEHHELSHNEEYVPTEVPEEHLQSEEHVPTEELHGSSEIQNLEDDKIVSESTVPTVDTHPSSVDHVTEQVTGNAFEPTPEVEKEPQEIGNPPIIPSVYQPEESQSPTTEKISDGGESEVTTATAPSKTEENDSIPESSEHIDEVPTQEKEKSEEEENKGPSTIESGDNQSNHEATSPTVITTTENTHPALSSEGGEAETEHTVVVENNNNQEEIQSVVDQEKEQQGMTSSDSTSGENKSPVPVEHTAPHDLSTIIYEEVKVTGMPSIESHVTEGTLDHSVSHEESSHSAETTVQTHQESEENQTPGPVGIEIPRPSENQEGTIKEENVNQNEGKLPQENSETESTPTISPDIINEIDEEKQSLHQISSDNTAHLIDDINQIIQNEVNNQLYSNGQQTHQSEDPHKSSVENEAEPNKDSHDGDQEQGTTVTPSVEEPNAEGEGTGESSETAEEHGHNDITGQEVGTENVNVADKEPVQTQQEHHEEGDDITATHTVTIPPTTDPSSITLSHVDVSNQNLANENEHQTEQTDETSQNQSSSETPNANDGNGEQYDPYHTTEPNVNPSQIAEESLNQNKDGNNEISTESVHQQSSEKEITQGAITESPKETPESHEETSSSNFQGELGAPVVNEDQNLISEDVTHVINSDSQVPDSANQILVASGDGEAVPTTEQAVHIPESEVNGAPLFPEEENIDTITQVSHQEENNVHHEGNTIPEDNHPITESGHEEVSSQGDVSEEVSPPQHEPAQVSEEHGTVTHETPTLHQGEPIPDHPSDTNYVAVTELSPEQSESQKPNTDENQHIEDSENQETMPVQQETIPDHTEESLSNHESVSENQEPTAEHHDGESVTQSPEHHEGEITTQTPEHHKDEITTQTSEHHEGEIATQSPEHHEGDIVNQLSEHHEGDIVSQPPDHHEGEIFTQSPEHHEGDIVTQSTEHHEGEIVTQSPEHHEGEIVTPSPEHHEGEIVTQSPEHHEGEIVTQSSEHHDGEINTHLPEHHESEITESPEHHESGITQLPEHHESEVTQSPEHHESELTQSPEHHESEITQSPEHHEGEPVTRSPGHNEGEPATQSPVHLEGEVVTQSPELHEDEVVTQSIEHHEGEIVTNSPEHHEIEIVTHSPEHHEGEINTHSPEHHEGEINTHSPEHHEGEINTHSPEHHEGEINTHSPEHHDGEIVTHLPEHHDGLPVTYSPEHHEGEPVTESEQSNIDLASQSQEQQYTEPAIQTHPDSESTTQTPEHHDSESSSQTFEHPESEQITTQPEHPESEQVTTQAEHHDSDHTTEVPVHHETDHTTKVPEHLENELSTHSSEHHDSSSVAQETSSQSFENNENDQETSTRIPIIENSSETTHSGEHVSTEGIEAQKHDTPEENNATGDGERLQAPASPETVVTETVPSSSIEPEQKPLEGQQPDFSQNIVHSTETASYSEAPSSTEKPIEEPSPMFPTWSQKPLDQHTTPEPHPPEENAYPSGFDPEYEDEEGISYGPGTCRYGGKVYLSAQQIPRDDPCDFCFCFRSDIICLQQSCPPPIRGCYQETIKGFCCPRYECHVSMATMVNVTTTTTTTTTTVPPLFFSHAYSGSATKAGCQVKGVAYHVGEKIPSTSGPCLECRCGANGQMKCDPTVCGPQEALLRQVMDAAVSRRRR